MQATLDPGDEVLILEPAFDVYVACLCLFSALPINLCIYYARTLVLA